MSEIPQKSLPCPSPSSPILHSQALFSFADESFSLVGDQTKQGELGHHHAFSSAASNQYRVSPSYDQVYLPYYDLDTKWRSVAVAHQNPNLSTSGHNMLEKQHKKTTCPGYDEKLHDMSSSCESDKIGFVQAPEQPILLTSTHFHTNVPLSCVLSNVERALLHFSEVSFEMFPDSCKWNVIYLRGSAHSKFQIHVYSHGTGHIIEAIKVSGDCAPFRLVWTQIKAQMTNESFPEPRSLEAFCAPSAQLLSDDEAIAALTPVLEMATSGMLNQQLEAARIFCDLSQDACAMQHHMCDSGCVQALVENLLTCDRCEWTKQHAVFALANLSETQGCQEAMIDAGVLPILLQLVKDGPYNTAEMRRESARILANLSARLAPRVVTVLGPRTLSIWLDKVDSFHDERLKLHACRAKESLKEITC